jgi:hypothetical protein
VRGKSYRLGRDAWTQMELGAGKSGVVEFSLPDDIHELCVAQGCDVVFLIEAALLAMRVIPS